MSMEGKIVALTGGGSGIGLATAKVLSARGATVCVADIDPKALASAAEYFTSKSVPFMVTEVDVSKRVEVNSWVEDIVEKYGRLGGAANCAGIIGKHHGIRTIAHLEDDGWDNVIGVNLTSMMYCFPGYGSYGASKHGVVGLVRVAAKEVGHRNIRVNALAPGAIQTPLMTKA